MTPGPPSPPMRSTRGVLSPPQKVFRAVRKSKSLQASTLQMADKVCPKIVPRPHSSSLHISISSDSVQAHPFKPRAFQSHVHTREARILKMRPAGPQSRPSHLQAHTGCRRQSAAWAETARIWCVCKSSLGPFDAPHILSPTSPAPAPAIVRVNVLDLHGGAIA